MRRLAVVIAGLLVMTSLLVSGLVLSLNRLIASKRDGLLESATALLGRTVAVDTISVSLWGGIGLRVANLSIAEDPRFNDGAFLHAAAVTARFKLWPLLHRRIEVARIDMHQLELHIVRDESGRWNYATLKLFSAADRPRTSSGAPSLVTVAASTPTAAHAALSLIRPTRATDTTIVLVDRSEQPPRTVRTTHIDLALVPVPPNGSIRFSLDAALQADARNIHVRGTVGALDGDPIPLEISGDVGPFDPQVPRIEDLQLKADITAGSIRVAHLGGQVLAGTFSVSGRYPVHRDGEAVFSGQFADVSMLQLTRLAHGDNGPAMEGEARGTIDLRGRGPAVGVLQTSLNGSGAADINDGIIKNLNLVNEVLGRVTGLPGIGDLISANVKPKYARLFSASDTTFETLHVSFRVADQRIHADELTIVATDFGVHASGWIGFDREADLSGTLSMSKRFSNDVATDVKEAKYLLDDGGQLAVPFRLRGKLGKARPKPDTNRLINLLANAVTHGAAEDLLKSLIGGKRRQGMTPAPTDSEQDSIEKGLRKLFGR